MNRLAFDNPAGDLFTLTDQMVDEGVEASRKSKRKRIVLPIHRKQDAEVQRLINFLQPGTYIRPHLHPRDHASESIVVIQGAIRFFTFDNEGRIRSEQQLSSDPMPDVIDIEPRMWHSFLVLKPDTIIFECKKGPYDADLDKRFAEWSPEEGSAEVEGWMKSITP